MDHVLKDMKKENIPAMLGGEFQLYNEPFEFDVSSTSTLYYPGCEDDAAPYILKRREFEKHDPEEYCYYWNGITPPDSKFRFVSGLEVSRSVSSPFNSESAVLPQLKRSDIKVAVDPNSKPREPFLNKIIHSIRKFPSSCYKRNPVLTLVGVFLMLFVIEYHPHALTSIVPAIIGGFCLTYLYLTTR